MSGYLGEREASKKALLNALRKEIAGIPEEGKTDDILMQLQDGTYPLEGGVEGERSEGEVDSETDEETEDEHSSGDEVEGVQPKAKTGEGSGDSHIMAMLRKMEKSRQKDMTVLNAKHEQLQSELQKLKKKDRSTKKKDLLETLGRVKTGIIVDNDDETENDSSDSDDDDLGGSSSTSLRRTKRSNARFFKKFARGPFPEQTVLVDSLEGENMLRKALTNYPTISAWTEARHLSSLRNKREACTLAKIIDCIISSQGIIRAKNEPAIELSIRRLAAVVMADKTGSWAAARELEEEHDELVRESLRRKLHKSAKLRKELSAPAKKDKSALPEGRETS